MGCEDLARNPGPAASQHQPFLTCHNPSIAPVDGLDSGRWWFQSCLHGPGKWQAHLCHSDRNGSARR